MKCVAVIVFGLLALANGRPEEKPAVDPLGEIIKNAQIKIADLTAEMQKQFKGLGVDQNNIAEVFQNQSTVFVNNVKNYVNKVSDEIKAKSPEAEKVWEDLKVRLGKIAEDINAKVPNAKESAELLQKQWTEGVQTVIRETNVLADAIKANSGQVKEEVGKITESLVNLAVEASQGLNKQLKAVAGGDAKAA